MGIGREMMYELQAEAAWADTVRERAIASKTWITRDGREVPVREMTDSHLANSIRMMRRGGTGCFGEMAPMALEMLETEERRRRLR